MDTIIGKTIEMKIDGESYRINVIDFNEFEIVGKDEGGVFIHIPKMKAGVYKVIDDISRDIYLYVCKNEISGCKGKRALSLKNNLEKEIMECPCSKEHDCHITNVGSFYRFPLNIQLAILNDMASKNPLLEIAKQKEKLDGLPKRNK